MDKAWESSPSNAFLYNALAQTMCMAAVHAVIPEVQDAGCAPAPKPTAALREAQEALELEDTTAAALACSRLPAAVEAVLQKEVPSPGNIF